MGPCELPSLTQRESNILLVSGQEKSNQYARTKDIYLLGDTPIERQPAELALDGEAEALHKNVWPYCQDSH